MAFFLISARGQMNSLVCFDNVRLRLEIKNNRAFNLYLCVPSFLHSCPSQTGQDENSCGNQRREYALVLLMPMRFMLGSP